MRAPVEWIRRYVELPPSVTTTEIADAFVRVGLEVEAVHTVPPAEGALVVGEVRKIEELTGFKKPIRFTQVDLGPGNGPDGSDEPRGIICGAQNFVVGDHVVVAMAGAVLPGGFEIAARKTYGHVSDGMICSVRELGIGDDHDGILVLDADAEVGTDARELIGANDAVIEFSITPDRGYTLSIRGLARELAAAFDAPYTDPADIPLREAGPGRDVDIDTERCARFVAVEANGVDPAAPAPWYMRRRLAAAGIRSISLAVDVTNYVMLETGHPLHAFDADMLDGGIVVRRATAGETLRTLDDKDRTLDHDDVVVADQSRALSLAGVMGGADSEISPATTNVVIEAASWDPPSVSRTVRRHRLPSEAARRYERSVDPAISAAAAESAAALLIRYGGGTLGGRTDAGSVRQPATITLPTGEATRLAGRYYTLADMVQRLEQVGCRVEQPDDSASLLVTPPTWRPDLTRPADLVEEIARLEGYGTIIPMLPIAPAGSGLTAEQRRRRRVADTLAGAGLTQVLSFPFLGEGDLNALGVPDDDLRRRAVAVANPLDTDRPLMATTLLPGLLSTALRNIARGSKDLALYEIGQVVLPDGRLPRRPDLPVTRRPSEAEQQALFAAVPAQPVYLAAVLTGQWERAGWWGAGRAADVTDIFAVARRIGAVCGVTVSLRAAEYAPWHPGRCAEIVAGAPAADGAGGQVIGHAGDMHPAVVERLGLPARTLALEVDLSAIGAALPPVPPTVSPFPPVHLDVALIVDANVDADSVMHALEQGGGDLLESTRLFDVYQGDQIADGKKSLAFSLVVRATDRTLTLAEATGVRDAAVASAAARTGAEIRA
jgi:phenylalanyl-tRNA synthetase beta chain